MTAATATVRLAAETLTAGRLRALLRPLLAAGRRVAVDLGAVTEVDLPVLAVLVAASREVERRGGRLTVVAAGEPVRRLAAQHGLLDAALPVR